MGGQLGGRLGGLLTACDALGPAGGGPLCWTAARWASTTSPVACRAARTWSHRVSPPATLVHRSKMGLNDKLYFTDLSIPVGAALNTKLDTSLPILKVAK